MKLLIITQKVNKNDQILGFFHRWIIEFAKHVKKLTVICLEEGEHDLPKNVQVLSIGKDQGVGKLGRLWRLYTYIWKYRKEYDRVFVHMNPVYVVWCWKMFFLLRKPVYLWYTHKNVDLKLRIASLFVQKIFTASPESLRLETTKKYVTGHGIDVDFFAPDTNVEKNQKSILTISRISKAKRIDLIIDVLAVLPEYTLDIVGDVVTTTDELYMKECKQKITTLQLENRVTWYGAIPHSDTRDFYRRTGVFVNVSETGSLDKTILEALACGTLVVSSNDVARSMPGVAYSPPEVLSLKNFITQTISQDLNDSGRLFAAEHHSLPVCIERLINVMK